MANTLSTEAPTDFGGNFVATVEKCWELWEIGLCAGIISLKRLIDHLLINSLQTTFHMACSGQRTSCPQKRQQRLGASLEVIQEKKPGKTVT